LSNFAQTARLTASVLPSRSVRKFLLLVYVRVGWKVCLW